ncbi:hypothetical protein FRC00_006331 [Tulasnella sp. 408]|nr:hypothetical protein FRC00_006331 [Tulasnella sp. 408]
MCAYFWASAVQTLAFSSRLRKAAAAKARPTEGREYPLQQWPRFLQLLHVFLACTIFVFPFVVTIVFWALLADGAFSNEFNSWKNISVHALNAAFALLEILLSRIVPRWSNIPILILVLGGYIGVAYITHATQGFYTYSFLDPSHGAGKLAGYIVGIPVAAIIILAIIKGVCWVRDKIFARRAPRPSEDEYHLREKGSRV